MDYITDATFWIVVLSLGGALWGVWYRLHKEIDKVTNDLDELKKSLKSGFTDLSEASLSDMQEINETFNDLLFLIGKLYSSIGVIEKHSDKKISEELDNLYSEDDTRKLEAILKKYKK